VAWRTWATRVFGLQEVAAPPGAPADHLYLRMDERAWRFAIEPGDEGRLAYTGWEVASPASLRVLEERLAEAGIRCERDAELARVRRVEDLIRCEDPNGFQLEFFCGGFVSREPFVSPLGVKFVTGDMGLGHILLTVQDVEATKRFYLDLLGFRLTDFIEFGPNKVHFTRVNPRHHSLAFVQARGGAAQLGHFMVEVSDVDAVGRALDRIHAGMGRVTETLGRHTNDLMLSFYCENPSGSQAEYGCGGRVIDEATWTVTTYDATAFWGHKVPGSEYSEAGPVSPREQAK
jgi:3,4-dihydroxy-9,10-secoandrosta-1,3,5(10)-triene-9,17-dione 4,5-dioxygenase